MSNQNQGFRVGAPNAESIQRRNLQLQQWNGSDTDQIDPMKARNNLIQFQLKFMFLDSVAQQDAEEVKKLLALGVDVNYTNTDGISALHQVCIDGNEEIAEILLKHNPSINAPDNDGWTPLHAAAQCGFTDLARILLEAGADIACVDNEGQLPIDKAEEDDMSQLLAGWMRKRGVNLEQVRTAEERALRDACDKAVRSRTTDLEVVTVDGASILHCAAAKGLPDCITMLCRAGISMNLQDYDGWTPLHAAARWAQPEAIVALIENGADIHIVNTFAETPLDIADEDVLDMLKEYYDSSPARTRPVVPGVGKFLKPDLPDKTLVQPIMKGSRKLRENKENQPVKLSKTIEEAKKEAEVNEVKEAPPAQKPKPRSRFEPAAAVENKPGPAGPAWAARRNAPEKNAPEKAASSDNLNTPKKRPWAEKRAAPAPAVVEPATPNKLSPDIDSAAKRPAIPTINTDDTKCSRDGSDVNKAEVVRKTVSRQKRNERRSTQAVNMEDLVPAAKEVKPSDEPTKEPASTPMVNGPDTPGDAKKRHAPVTVQITDAGTLAWDSKKSPEGDTPSPVTTESASDKAEVVRKKVARRKRDERRSTQHVSQEDLPSTPNKQQPDAAASEEGTSSKDKEDHLAKELELERLRYEESAAALARNQEDLRKRENKINTLEKENETMRKKITDLEEDLRRLHQVNNDNQRLRDENAALIRVIGKLSRNPL